MRASVSLDADVITNLLSLTGEKSQTKAIQKALQSYIQTQYLADLRKLKGKVSILANDSLEELEKAELD